MRATAGLMLALVGAAFAQTPDPSLAFDVASVKLHQSTGPNDTASTKTGGPGTPDPGQITVTNRTLRGLLVDAFAIKGYQLEVPESLTDARYDIAAKVPAGATTQQARVMMQNLLIERLHLKIHHESRNLQVYALIVAKGGSKLTPSTDAPAVQPKAGSDGFPVQPIDPINGGIYTTYNNAGNGKVVGFKQTIARLISMISGNVDQPILDMTGLTGKYDFSFIYGARWTRNGASTASADPADTFEGSAPALTEAVEKSLGLKLDPRKVPMDMVIVDSGEKTPERELN